MHYTTTSSQTNISKEQKFDQMLADLKLKYCDELKDVSKLSDYFLTRHDNNGQLHLIWKAEAYLILPMIKVEVKVIADRIFGPYASPLLLQETNSVPSLQAVS